MFPHTAAALELEHSFPKDMQSFSFWDIATIALIIVALVLVRTFINFAQRLHLRWSRFQLR